MENGGQVLDRNGVPIPELRISAKSILNRTIALYGASGSGKTQIILYLLDLLRPEVDQVLVVSPTEPANRSYDGIVPAPLIHYTLTSPDPRNPNRRIGGAQGAVGFMDMIWNRQEMLMQSYSRGNNINIIEKLLRRVSRKRRNQAQKDLEPFEQLKEKTLKRIKRRYRHSPGQAAENSEKIKKIYDEVTVKVYKRYIMEEIESLCKLGDRLDEDERWALQYLEVNPRLVLIFDDCAAELKSIFTKPSFRKLFYQGRHYSITTIFTFQDDTDLNTALRKNVFYSIYCEQRVCQASFERKASGVTKQEKERVDEVADAIYEHPWRKLAYLREDPKGVKFYWFMAPSASRKPFGSEPVLELCREMEVGEGKIDRNNPFFNNFSV